MPIKRKPRTRRTRMVTKKLWGLWDVDRLVTDFSGSQQLWRTKADCELGKRFYGGKPIRVTVTYEVPE